MPVVTPDWTMAMLMLETETEPRIQVMLGIFFISLIAVSFPGLSKQVKLLRIPHAVFFIGKHFGTGVILSTAFCHLLPDAFGALTSKVVKQRYPGLGHWTGAIILGSLLLIFLVEYASTTYVDHLHSNESTLSTPVPSLPPSRPKTPALLQHNQRPSSGSQSSPAKIPPIPSPTPQTAAIVPIPVPRERLAPTPPENYGNALVTEATPLIRSNHQHHHRKRTRSLCSLDQYHRYHHNKAEPVLPLVLYNSPRLLRGGAPLHAGDLSMWDPRDVRCACRMAFEQVGDEPESVLVDDIEEEQIERQRKPKVSRRRQVIGILVLQLGIMIHSLVIGLTLSVTTGSDFTTLVTAIIFHQLFEGLSLGIRIASIPPPVPTSDVESITSRTRRRNWLPPTLSMLFAVTTPLGILLGMLAFSRVGSSQGESAQMKFIQGLMSGISAGMLIYAATVEMLAGDFVFGDVSGDHGHPHHEPGHRYKLRAEESDSDVSVQGVGHDLGHEHEHEHEHEHGTQLWKKALAVVSLLTGAVAMALVGE